MSDEALRLLDEIRQDIRSGRSYPAIAPRIDAFLANIPETAAREAALWEKLNSFGVAHTDGVWHLHTCDAGFIDGEREACEDDCAEIAALLADTSPAAAALLARGEKLREIEAVAGVGTIDWCALVAILRPWGAIARRRRQKEKK